MNNYNTRTTKRLAERITLVGESGDGKSSVIGTIVFHESGGISFSIDSDLIRGEEIEQKTTMFLCTYLEKRHVSIFDTKGEGVSQWPLTLFNLLTNGWIEIGSDLTEKVETLRLPIQNVNCISSIIVFVCRVGLPQKNYIESLKSFVKCVKSHGKQFMFLVTACDKLDDVKDYYETHRHGTQVTPQQIVDKIQKCNKFCGVKDFILKEIDKTAVVLPWISYSHEDSFCKVQELMVNIFFEKIEKMSKNKPDPFSIPIHVKTEWKNHQQ
jgi:hypothetical protein